MLQEKLKLDKAAQEFIITEGLYCRVIPSDEGRITMVFVDALYTLPSVKSVLFFEENCNSEHELVLDAWCLNKTAKPLFKSPEKGLVIDGVTYLKGPKKILRLKKDDPNADIV